MEVATINTVLGQRAGALELVFRLLPPWDMKNVVLVCQLWREAGEAQGLWAWVIFRVTRENMSTMPERLSSRRLQAVWELRVEWGVEVEEEVVQAVARHLGLQVVQMGGLMGGALLSSVMPGTLARAVTKLEEVRMFGTELSRKQKEAILTAITQKNCQLKKLNISHINLSSVSPSLLASAVNLLEEAVMYATQLTSQQMEAILTGICGGDSRVKNLDVTYSNLSTVDSGLLACAVNMLEEVEMEDTQLTVQQGEAILTQSLVKTSLRRLNMGGVLGLDGGLVGRAELAIGELILWGQRM